MAQDRNFRDTQQQQQGEFAASRYYSPRDEGQARAQMAEQQQRAQLQAQIQQEDFSHADNVRLSELKQGQNEILKQADQGQITGAERDRMLLQLRTGGRGINVLNDRQQQTQIKHQDLVNKQIKQATQLALEDSESKGKLEEARLAYSTAALQGKLKFVPNDQAMAEMRAQILRDVPGTPPDLVDKIATEELQRQGRGQQMFTNEKGVPQVVKAEHLPAGEGGDSHGGRGQGPREFDTTAAMKEAIHSTQKMLTDGVIKPEEAAAKRQELFDAFEQAHAAHQDKQGQAKAAGNPAPFDLSNPTAASPKQLQQLSTYKDKVAEYGNRTDLPPDVRQKAMQAVQSASRISAAWSGPDGALAKKTPKYARDAFDAANKFLENLPKPGEVRLGVRPGGEVVGGPAPGSAEEKIARLRAIQAQERNGVAPLSAVQPGGPQFAAPDDPRYGQTQAQTGYRTPGERLDRLGVQLGEAAGNVRQDIGKWLRDY